ncbi:hypothetical protein BDY19DRAFT_334985 [Irpex rosettiformis]|uniref:Uncharacterized protein n=1 Tax=Irpex rosettiformis TaxID=378272 RepID=A0ACB8TXY9_9APHY|nr:hypothetical protein BDY19DRAFT_334985 [Irpex rosettiformis]
MPVLNDILLLGKSIFLSYALIRRLESAVPTLFQISNDIILYFSSTGVETFGNDNPPESIYCTHASTTWCLTRFSWCRNTQRRGVSAGGWGDGVVDRPEPRVTFAWRVTSIRMVCEMTPGVSPGWLEWLKQSYSTDAFILDGQWRRGEIGALLTQLRLDVVRGMEVCDKYGPCPRTVLMIVLSESNPAAHIPRSFPGSAYTPFPSSSPTSPEASHLVKIQLAAKLFVHAVVQNRQNRYFQFLEPTMSCSKHLSVKILEPWVDDETIYLDPYFRARSRLAWEILYSLLFMRPLQTNERLPTGYPTSDSPVTQPSSSLFSVEEKTTCTTSKLPKREIQRCMQSLSIPTSFLLREVARAILDMTLVDQREVFIRLETHSMAGDMCTCLLDEYPDPFTGPDGLHLKQAAGWIFAHFVLARLQIADDRHPLVCFDITGRPVDVVMRHTVDDTAEPQGHPRSSIPPNRIRFVEGTLAHFLEESAQAMKAFPPTTVYWRPTPGCSSIELPGIDALVRTGTNNLWVVHTTTSPTIGLRCELSYYNHKHPVEIFGGAARNLSTNENSERQYLTQVGVRTVKALRSLRAVMDAVYATAGRCPGGEVEGSTRSGGSGSESTGLPNPPIPRVRFMAVFPYAEDPMPLGFPGWMRENFDKLVPPTDGISRDVETLSFDFDFGSVQAEHVLSLMTREGENQ